ncbi:MAG: VCBS repeat-containing protein [Actinomycetota bacterium]
MKYDNKKRLQKIAGMFLLALIGLTLNANAAAPANDNFANAQALDLPVYNVGIDNTQATGEVGEPNHAGASGALHSVWFKWTAPDNYSITIEAVGNLDSTLAVYTGVSVNALTQVAANDNVGNGQNKYSRVTFAAVAGTTYRIAVAGAGGAVGATILDLDINAAESGRISDFDGNARSDFALFRPSNNTWYIDTDLYSNDKLYLPFGLAGDYLLSGDYTGDGNSSDACAWRESTGVFYVLNHLNNTVIILKWGITGDIPVSGDFDGDDVADFAVWRPSTGTFWVRKSRDGTALIRQWGAGTTDIPIPADYDGDGKTDFAVRRQSGAEEGNFYILRSSDNSYIVKNWGLKSDFIVPGDYDFDGKSDIAVYRPGDNTYYVIGSQTGAPIYKRWGTAGDIPVSGEYITNPHSAFNVWRPSTGTLYILDRNDNGYAFQWGTSGDFPINLLDVF